MKQCSKGCTGIAASDNYCWNDGSKLIDITALRCTCGEQFDNMDIFCSNCGSSKKTVQANLNQRLEKGSTVERKS